MLLRGISKKMGAVKKTKLRSQKDVYVAGKLSVITQEVKSVCDINKYEKATFLEALTMLEKSSAKEVLESSYLVSAHNNVIGKVEYFTNSFATTIYQKIFKAASSDLRELLEKYYLKYQIHNIISTLRCIAYNSQDEVKLYLIGNKVQKEHCIKATSYSYEEALRYFSTKFKFPKSYLEFNTINSIMYLETALYSWYHQQLQLYLSQKYNGSSLQIEHKKHIDILNQKIVLLDSLEEDFNAKEFSIKGGNISIDDISSSKLISKELKELDELQSEFKITVYNSNKKAPYASYAMILNFMQQLELNLQTLSRMLKEKALNEL